MEPIKERDFTDPVKQRSQKLAIERAEKHTDKVLSDYAARSDTYGGRYICADTFKELLPGYGESPASRNALNGAVHNSAAVLSSEQFRRLVEAGPKTTNEKVIFLTGIPGAGKSSSVKTSFDVGAVIVFEGQMSRPEPSIKKIEAALEKGFDVSILAVHVSPETALERTNFRYLDRENGRGASINVMAEIQGNLPDGLRQIHERFGSDVKLTILENNPSSQRVHNGWDALPILAKEGNRDRIYERLTNALESGFREERYSAGFYTQAAGREPDRSLLEKIGRSTSAEQQKDGVRPGLSQGNASANTLNPYLRGRSTPKPPVVHPALLQGAERGQRGRAR